MVLGIGELPLRREARLRDPHRIALSILLEVDGDLQGGIVDLREFDQHVC